MGQARNNDAAVALHVDLYILQTCEQDKALILGVTPSDARVGDHCTSCDGAGCDGVSKALQEQRCLLLVIRSAQPLLPVASPDILIHLAQHCEDLIL